MWVSSTKKPFSLESQALRVCWGEGLWGELPQYRKMSQNGDVCCSMWNWSCLPPVTLLHVCMASYWSETALTERWGGETFILSTCAASRVTIDAIFMRDTLQETMCTRFLRACNYFLSWTFTSFQALHFVKPHGPKESLLWGAKTFLWLHRVKLYYSLDGNTAATPCILHDCM